MKYTFHIVDVFSSTPVGGNQLAEEVKKGQVKLSEQSPLSEEYDLYLEAILFF